MATTPCKVIYSYKQTGANTHNSITNWVGICPSFFKSQDENAKVSASQTVENGDSC